MPLNGMDAGARWRMLRWLRPDEAAAAVLRKALLLVLGQGFLSVGTFAYFASAAAIVAPQEYGRITHLNASVMIVGAALDMGLSISTLAQFTRTGDVRVLSADVLHRWGLLVAALIVASLLALAGHIEAAVVAMSGAGLNILTGMRPLLQVSGGRHAYAHFAALSTLFRLLALVPLGLGQSVLLSLSIFYIAPGVVALFFYASVDFCTKARTAVYLDLLKYSAPVFVSALCFMCIPLLPVFAISHRLGSTATASFGVVLTCLGPLSLIIVSLRASLIPLAITGTNTTPRNLGRLTLFVALGIAAGTALGAFALHHLVPKYPLAAHYFAIFFPFYAATSILGLLNTRVHKIRTTREESYINVARLIVAASLLFLIGGSAEAILLTSGVVLLTGEVLLAMYVQRKSNVPCEC